LVGVARAVVALAGGDAEQVEVRPLVVFLIALVLPIASTSFHFFSSSVRFFSCSISALSGSLVL
jgi:hypothetical protein